MKLNNARCCLLLESLACGENDKTHVNMNEYGKMKMYSTLIYTQKKNTAREVHVLFVFELLVNIKKNKKESQTP